MISEFLKEYIRQKSYEDAQQYIDFLEFHRAATKEPMNKRLKYELQQYNKKVHGIPDNPDIKLPMLVKTRHYYTYNKKYKECDMYLLVFEQISVDEYFYYMIRPDGKEYERHFLRSGYLDREILVECKDPPASVRRKADYLMVR